MGKLLSFFGRVLLATLFIFSGISKFTTYDAESGGPFVETMKPKIDCFLKTISDVVPDVPVSKIQEQYKYLCLFAAGLEVFGGLLFILDFTLGSCCLMLFLLAVTPIMHNFWEPDCYSSEQIPEMINFMKNLSIFGGLVAYTTKSASYAKLKVD